MQRIAIAIIATISSTAAAPAQECIDIARVIGRDIERYADKNQVETVRKAQLCSAEWDSATTDQRAQIQAAYGLFSGGASGSDQQIRQSQKERCESQYGSYWYSRIQDTELNRVSQYGSSVVQDCLNQKSFRLIKLAFNDRAFSASYRYGGVGATKINGVAVSPATIATCSAQFDGKTRTDLEELQGMSINSGEVFTISCERSGKALADGRTHFEGGLVSVSTQADAPLFPLIKYDEPLISQDSAESLSRRIDELTTSLKTVTARADRLEKQTAAIYRALSFGAVPPIPRGQSIVFNGTWDQSPCPPNSVVREVRISYENIVSSPKGSITCVSLKPDDIP